MSCTITHRPHRCDLPGTLALPGGTRAKCDECGQEWEIEWLLFIGRKWLRYPRPPLPEDVEDTSKLGDDKS